MTLYNHFVKKISFPLLTRHYGIPNLFKELNKLEESQFWDKNKIETLQLKKLSDLLTHAYKTTQYYKNLFDDSGFSPESLCDFSDMKKIPYLTKNIIRENSNSLVSNCYREKDLHSSETGGTTGVKMKFWRNNDCLSIKEASRFRFEKWAGWDFGQRMGLVWPAQQDYVGHWSIKSKLLNELYERQVVLPAAILNESMIDNYISELKQKKPTMIRAFNSPLMEVANVIIDKSHKIDFVKGIVTTGEPLFIHQRNIIEKAFNCGVYNSYRSREAGTIAQECSEHKGLHINCETLYVEVIKSDGKNNDGDQIGELVVTDLSNYGMPLVRYKIGDMASLSSRTCKCGRGLPMLDDISGRTGDYLLAPNGSKIAAGSMVLYLVDEAPGLIGQVQIIQDQKNHLLIKITPHPHPTEEIIEYQRRTITRLFGPDMGVTFEIVDKIPRSDSGKYFFTKRLID